MKAELFALVLALVSPVDGVETWDVLDTEISQADCFEALHVAAKLPTNGSWDFLCVTMEELERDADG